MIGRWAKKFYTDSNKINKRTNTPWYDAIDSYRSPDYSDCIFFLPALENRIAVIEKKYFYCFNLLQKLSDQLEDVRKGTTSAVGELYFSRGPYDFYLYFHKDLLYLKQNSSRKEFLQTYSEFMFKHNLDFFEIDRSSDIWKLYSRYISVRERLRVLATALEMSFCIRVNTLSNYDGVVEVAKTLPLFEMSEMFRKVLLSRSWDFRIENRQYLYGFSYEKGYSVPEPKRLYWSNECTIVRLS